MNKRIEKGITLIALIITIIVLLILAGVTINMLTGENGIFSRASNAKIKTEIADVKEKIQIEILENQSENNGNISEDKLNEIIANYDKDNKIREDKEEKYIITKKGYEIKVSDIISRTPPVEEEPIKPYVLAETIGGANSPDISKFNVEKTHYVTWGEAAPYQRNELNETNTIDKEPPIGWSNYSDKKWANIITTGGENECYWVWIPRYAYKITYTAEDRSSGTIDVVFLKGQTNNDMNEKDVTSSSYVDTKGQTGAYKVHPAFTNEGNGGFGNLTGIWVAKFEASSTSVSVVENPTEKQLEITGGVVTADVDTEGNKLTNTDLKVRVKPNVTSWRGITVNDIFKVCQNLVEPNNSLCSTNNTKNNKLDSHMMKNTEWGACAYLSISVYGKNSEVWNNPYYNNQTYFSPITGLCGNSEGYATTTYNDTNTYKYNTAKGVNASISGNVYGVYDMAGGAWEYVAGILSSNKKNGNNEEKNNYYDFSDEKYTTGLEKRYIDWYIVTSDDVTENYNANSEKYGDAVYETSSYVDKDYTGGWFTSLASFPPYSGAMFVRGGNAANKEFADVFAFNAFNGGDAAHIGFRPVVISSQS